MSTINTLLEPGARGSAVSIVNGRSLSDLQETNDGQLSPLAEIVRAALLDRGLLMVEFSRSGGVSHDPKAFTDKGDQTKADALVEALRAASRDQREPSGCEQFNALAQGLLALGRREPKERVVLRDGRPLHVAVFAHFAEHVVPTMEPAHRSEHQVRALESVLDLVRKPSFRKSGHLLFLVEGRPGTIDPLLQQELPIVRLAMPDVEAKQTFVSALARRYPNARPVEGYTYEEIARASANTPNSATEGLFVASHREQKPIVARDVWARKQEAVTAMSEGTLRSMDPTKSIAPVGKMTAKALAALMNIAEGLRRGDPNASRNIAMVGPASSGKTMLAQYAAAMSRIVAYEILSAKAAFVGESERLSRLQQDLLRDHACFGFIDELDMVLPDRNKEGHDGGTSQHLAGQWQTFLADTSIGRAAIIGTTNSPGALSPQMRSRFLMIPVLSASPADVPLILGSLCTQLGMSTVSTHALSEAAATFYRNGAASPREMRQALIATMSTVPAGVTPDILVLKAATEMINGSDHYATELGDLTALAYTRSRALLPWYDEQKGSYDRSFVLPAHIAAVLDEKTWEIDQAKLRNRLSELSGTNR